MELQQSLYVVAAWQRSLEGAAQQCSQEAVAQRLELAAQQCSQEVAVGRHSSCVEALPHSPHVTALRQPLQRLVSPVSS